MSDFITKVVFFIAAAAGIFAIVAALSLLLAFPVKWCWNYAVVSTFGLPVLTWGKAWCLSFLAGTFFKSHNFNSSK